MSRAVDGGARIQPGPTQAGWLARLDLGVSSRFLPAFLGMVHLGMGKDDLLRARTAARSLVRSTGRFSFSGRAFEKLEELPPGDGPVNRIDYHLRWDRLSEVRVRTRLTRVWPALVAKAIGKWGSPRLAGPPAWRWVTRAGLVELRAPIRGATVTLRLGMRAAQRGLLSKFGARSPRPQSLGKRPRPPRRTPHPSGRGPGNGRSKN